MDRSAFVLAPVGAVIFFGLTTSNAAGSDVDSRLMDMADKLVSTAGFSGKPTLAVLPFENHLTDGSKAGIWIAETYDHSARQLIG